MRPIIHRCRLTLENGRAKARSGHDAGTPGRQICTLLTDLYDDIVQEVFLESIADHSGDNRVRGISVVAHGGFGRCEVAPYSDADVMVLSKRSCEPLARTIAADLTRDLQDIGIVPGVSLRGIGEACALAWQDPVIYTSLTESRFLAGSLRIYQRFFNQFRHGSMRRQRRLTRGVVEARREERRKWGETTYMLRPNIKRSRGGLRDIQSIRWIGFAMFGESDLMQLVQLGLLPEEDFRQVRQALGFFLRLRNEMHFRSAKSVDVLDRTEQMLIASGWGYQGAQGILPVEQFMRDYFENARNVRYAATYCVEESTIRPLPIRIREYLLARRCGKDFEMGSTLIWVRPEARKRVANSLPDVLRLMVLANQNDRRIAHQTWRAIRLAVRARTVSESPDELKPDRAAIASFVQLMDEPSRLADLLRRLHDLRILDLLIPHFARIRGMLQFNVYHKYTVDAHSIRAVEVATQLVDDNSGMGRRYRRLEDKYLLHLTLLIHDIGKGFEEDHCIVGERMALEIGRHLNLCDDDVQTMAWLVRHHLIVNVYAFRHDLTDPQIVLEFAKVVGSIRQLELLVVHTVADLKAVGPDVASDWKLGLIEDLYRRTRRYYDSGDLPGSPDDPEMNERRLKLKQYLISRHAEFDESDWSQKVDSVPLSLLSRHEPAVLGDVIIHIFNATPDQTVLCIGRQEDVPGGIHYTVLRRERRHAIGTFARTAGALASIGLSVRRAQIERFEDFAWNDFWVFDDDAVDGEVTERRIDEVAERLGRLLKDLSLPLPPPRRRWAVVPRSADTQILPSKVTFDNETVDRYTIVSLFAYDSPGLLYRVADAMAQQSLVLNFAKIDTHLDQVADVFYITEQDGSLVTELTRQNEIRQQLLDVV